MGRDSSVGIATRYGLDGPGIESRWGVRLSAPVQTGSGAYPASYIMGTGSFPGVKRPGRGVDHPPPSGAEVEGRVELYIYSPCEPSWPLLGWPLPLTFTGNPCTFMIISRSIPVRMRNVSHRIVGKIKTNFTLNNFFPSHRAVCEICGEIWYRQTT